MSLMQLQDNLSRIAPESVFGFLINITLAFVLSLMLSRLYVLYGRSYSDRTVLASTFVLIAMTTMLVITVVKSSLALSLGLVGALSIVRFRTAIKEPEELAYLFLTIGIGLGLGAAARRTTIFACAVIFFIIWFRGQRSKSLTYPNLSLVLSRDTSDGKNPALKDLIDIPKKHCQRVDVIRFEESNQHVEVSLHVECRSFDLVQAIRDELKKLDPLISIMFIDNSSGKTL